MRLPDYPIGTMHVATYRAGEAGYSAGPARGHFCVQYRAAGRCYHYKRDSVPVKYLRGMIARDIGGPVSGRYPCYRIGE